MGDAVNEEQAIYDKYVQGCPNMSRYSLDMVLKKYKIFQKYTTSLIGCNLACDAVFALDLNKVHPSKWFTPFHFLNSINHYWTDQDLKRIKAPKRCIVCNKKNNKKQNIKLKMCKGCRKYWFCSKKHQKWNWKHQGGCRCKPF